MHPGLRQDVSAVAESHPPSALLVHTPVRPRDMGNLELVCPSAKHTSVLFPAVCTGSEFVTDAFVINRTDVFDILRIEVVKVNHHGECKINLDWKSMTAYNVEEVEMEVFEIAVMTAAEFEKLVQYHYDNVPDDWSVVASEEWTNYTDHLFHVSAEDAAKSWQGDRLKMFQENPAATMYVAGALFDDMVNRQILEPGRYLIRVSW